MAPKMQGRPRLEAVTQELAHLVQAQVSASKLTGDPNWDIYLQLLQGRLDDVIKAHTESLELLESPLILEYEKVMMNKIRAVAARAQIDILEWAMDLPTAMREASFNAQDTLKRLKLEDPY
jgi:hypothetical protein